MTKLSEIKHAAAALTSKQMSKLAAWLHEQMETADSEMHNGARAKRRVLKEHKAINKTYRLESVRCGKKNCHCAEGEPHGPYWYAY